MTKTSVARLAAMAALAGLLGGCHVEKTTNGDGKDVKIETPFGGMKVKTNEADVLSNIDLPAYPGAVAVNKDDKDHHSADVDMSFGGFTLRVKAADYRTDDSPDKVEAFYRNGLKRFGAVIACRNNKAIGSPASTPDGLTCDNTHNSHISVDDSGGSHKLELKAGSEKRQHLVTIDQDGSGTKFTLVALELPGHFSSEDADEDHRQ